MHLTKIRKNQDSHMTIDHKDNEGGIIVYKITKCTTYRRFTIEKEVHKSSTSTNYVEFGPAIF